MKTIDAVVTALLVGVVLVYVKPWATFSVIDWFWVGGLQAALLVFAFFMLRIIRRETEDLKKLVIRFLKDSPRKIEGSALSRDFDIHFDGFDESEGWVTLYGRLAKKKRP